MSRRVIGAEKPISNQRLFSRLGAAEAGVCLAASGSRYKCVLGITGCLKVFHQYVAHTRKSGLSGGPTTYSHKKIQVMNPTQRPRINLSDSSQKRPRKMYTDNAIKMGTWNVLSLLRPGDLQNLSNQAVTYTLDVLALQELRWSGSGIHNTTNGYTLHYSGHQNGGEFGVGFLIHQRVHQHIIDFRPVSKRICTVRLRTKKFNITIVNVHAPTEDKSDDVKDLFFVELEDIISNIPHHDIKIIVGDFNAKIGWSAETTPHIGPHSLHQLSNNNGQRVAELAIMYNLVVSSTFFQHKKIHKVTWRSNDGRTQNQIDHVMISKRHSTSISDVRSYRGADIDSDHMLVIFKYKCKLSSTFNKQAKKTVRWNIDALKDEESLQSYQSAVTEHLERHTENHEPQSNIQEQWQAIQSAVTTAAESTIGRRPPRPRNDWFDDECRQLVEDKRKLREKWLARNTRSTQTEYLLARKATTKFLRQKKREHMRACIENISFQAENGNSRDCFASARNLTKNFHPRSTAIKNTNGELRTNVADVLSVWHTHFQNLLNRNDEVPPIRAIAPHGEEVFVPYPTVEEVDAAVGRLKNGKAPGLDGIPAELLKHGGTTLASNLYDLVVMIWDQEELPEEWKTALMCPLHKKGDRLLCENYRGIALLNTAYKVFANVVLARIIPHAENIIGDYQCGFRPNRSTTDQCFTLRMILEKCWEYNITIHQLYIDFQQAYDSINRENLWAALICLGIPEKLVSLCRLTTSGSLCKVIVEGTVSDPFEITSGVRQGDALAPVLFNLALEYVIRKSGIETSRCIFNKSGQILGYADDIVLLGRRPNDIKDSLVPLDRNAKRLGLRINKNKTKWLSTPRSIPMANLGDNDYSFDNVEDFKYLGSTVTSTNDIQADIKTRIAAAHRVFYAQSRLLRSKYLSQSCKLALYKALIRPVLTFGSESWTMTTNDCRLLSTFERKVIRSIFGPVKVANNEYRIRMNHEIEHLLGDCDVIGFIKSSRVRWLGHVERSPSNRMIKKAFQQQPVGVRRRGRPRLRWRDDVEQDLREIGCRNWRERAMDRDSWRTTVQAAKSLHGI